MACLDTEGPARMNWLWRRRIRAPVVFVDPVASLDHRRINEVARQVASLANEALGPPWAIDQGRTRAVRYVESSLSMPARDKERQDWPLLVPRTSPASDLFSAKCF